MEMSKTGKEMLQLQADLAKEYGYKRLPRELAKKFYDQYRDTLPEYFKKNPGQGIRTLYTLDGTPIAKGHTQIVIGDYGAFVEIDKADIISENIKVKKGQEYRYQNKYYSERVKYLWLTATDNSDCKIYFQKKTVSYANYRPDCFYISPFECYASQTA